MPPTKVGLNPTYLREQTRFEDFQSGHHGGHPGYQNGKILSNSESLCSSDASHQGSSQSILLFGRRCCLKIFKIADMAAILDTGTE